MDILKLFEEATGQTVNPSKSSVYFSPNTGSNMKRRILRIMGFAIMNEDASYLGIPVIWGRGKKIALAFLKDRLMKKMKGWKGRFLSSAGREILVKAVVSAMPVYVMQLFSIPKTFCKDLNVLMNKFWWGGVEAKKYGTNWLAWDKMANSKKRGGMGFRDFKVFNRALLGKQAWRLIMNPNTKWALLLKAIYFSNTGPFEANKGRRSSWGWTSMYEGLQFIREGTRWNISNGSMVKIWGDSWVPGKKNFIVESGNENISNLRYVSDLITSDGKKWDYDLINSVFSEEDATAIIRIPIGKTNGSDKIVWHYANDGLYNAKLGYHRGMSEENQTSGAESSDRLRGHGMDWNSIWHLQCAPKMKHFVWKACHDVVPSNEARARRHKSRNKACERCQCEEETIEHLLFFCPHSVAIWRASNFSYTPSPTGFRSFGHWWMALTKMKEDINLNLVAATLWGIWKVRNNMIFNRIKGDPIKEWKSIESDFNDYISVTAGNKQNRNEGSTSANSVLNQNMGWEPPDIETIKVNCDASFAKTMNIAGIVAVARNREGVVVGGSNERVYTSSALAAECLAIRLGIELAEQHGWHKVVIESDSKTSIDMAHGRRSLSWEIEAIMRDVIAKMDRNDNLSLGFIPRTKNRLADWLAKATMKNECPHNWVNVIPDQLYHLITNE